MNADPIHDDLLNDLDTRREANLLLTLLLDIAEAPNRDDTATMIAFGLAFAAACDLAEADPNEVLDQVLDRFPDGEIDLDDDPAQGRFVFPAMRA